VNTLKGFKGDADFIPSFRTGFPKTEFHLSGVLPTPDENDRKELSPCAVDIGLGDFPDRLFIKEERIPKGPVVEIPYQKTTR
jgi:hypothetical protein